MSMTHISKCPQRRRKKIYRAISNEYKKEYGGFIDNNSSYQTLMIYDL